MKKLFTVMNVSGLLIAIGAAGGMTAEDASLASCVAAALVGLLLFGASEAGMRNIKRIRRYFRRRFKAVSKAKTSPLKKQVTLPQAQSRKTFADA